MLIQFTVWEGQISELGLCDKEDTTGRANGEARGKEEEGNCDKGYTAVLLCCCTQEKGYTQQVPD